MRRWLYVLTAACATLAAVSCTEKRPSSRDDAALLETLRLKQPPTPQHASELTFGDTIRLLGYELSPEQPSAAQPFRVTWYWQVLKPLPAGYRIFTHLSDGRVNRVNLDADRALRRVYPEDRWRAGDILRDEQSINLPGDWNSQQAVFYLGFYSGETRMPFSHGKDDGARRAEVLRVSFGAQAPSGSTPEPSVPRLIARRLRAPIKLDGKLDEPDWAAAQSTGAFVNTISGEAGAFEARAQVLYDADAIYCAFVVADDYLKATYKNPDDHLWEQDTVEVMFDPEGDAKNYFELQVSPRGVSFDTRYDAPRNPRPFGHIDWASDVKSGVAVNGTLDADAPDVGYTVELRVPWTAFATGEPPAARPGAGTTWRINFFVMDARERGQRAVGWSAPRVGDFHTLGQFGRVVFPEAP